MNQFGQFPIIALTAYLAREKLLFKIYSRELADEILAHNCGFGQHAGGRLGATAAPNRPHAAITAVPTIEEYNPKSTLVTKEHKPECAKFPFIDIHSHHWNPTPQHVDQLVKEMDTINLRVLVNLSGGSGEELRKTLAAMKGRYPDRFVVFANPSYEDINAPGYGNRAAERLAADVRNGAQGLKIFKNFGMDLKYATGERVHADDPIFDPLFEKCADLKIPVLIHIA